MFPTHPPHSYRNTFLSNKFNSLCTGQLKQTNRQQVLLKKGLSEKSPFHPGRYLPSSHPMATAHRKVVTIISFFCHFPEIFSDKQMLHSFFLLLCTLLFSLNNTEESFLYLYLKFSFIFFSFSCIVLHVV